MGDAAGASSGLRRRPRHVRSQFQQQRPRTTPAPSEYQAPRVGYHGDTAPAQFPRTPGRQHRSGVLYWLTSHAVRGRSRLVSLRVDPTEPIAAAGRPAAQRQPSRPMRPEDLPCPSHLRTVGVFSRRGAHFRIVRWVGGRWRRHHRRHRGRARGNVEMAASDLLLSHASVSSTTRGQD